MLKLFKSLFRFFFGKKEKLVAKYEYRPEEEKVLTGGDVLGGLVKENTQEKTIVKEIPWFARKNDLVNEFSHDPIPVYSNRVDSNEIVGYLDGMGNIISKEGKMIVDSDQHKSEEELLADDVDFLKKHKNYAKPESNNKTVNYAIGVDPYKTESKSEDHDTNRDRD